MEECPIVVAIPARDEADHLGACLQALARQSRIPTAAVILLNNCTDESAAQIAAWRRSLPFAVYAPSVDLPRPRACAGWARRLAMEQAAELAGPSGVLLGTDADSVADRDWIAASVAAIELGADAVAGFVDIDPEDACSIPIALHDDDARECAYARQLDEIAALIDPDPADPWPRHDQHSGAAFAVTTHAWRIAGGIPPVRLGEDRAFFDALRRTDARIRHAFDARVIVSGRLQGRAIGGMADTMRRRLTTPDLQLDPRLEPAADAVQRASWRRKLRNAWRYRDAEYAKIAAELYLPAHDLARFLKKQYFGMAWAIIEARSSLLQRRLVPVSELPRQTAAAGLLIAGLRLKACLRDRATPERATP